MVRERPDTGRGVDEHAPPPGVAAADYIADILAGLVRVADANGLGLLAHMLKMAQQAALEQRGASSGTTTRRR